MHLFVQIVVWLIALAWITRAIAAARGLPSVPDLLGTAACQTPTGAPTVTVFVPARNEAKDIQACLDSLLAQDYPIRIIAVDDRSTDATGRIMDAMALRHPAKLIVLHVEDLPSEWLGKTYAMALAARQCSTDYLLFTDADIFFAPSALRLALAYAVDARADHLVLIPTTIIRRWDEAALLSFFQIFGLWAARPWKIADPKARRDAIGIGAFNLLRRATYEQIGGFEALRMQVVEDLGLGRRIKRGGLRQRVAFGRGLVSVHWAAGVHGLINVLTKNIFAAVNFHVALLLGGCAWLIGFCIVPWILLVTPGCRIPGALTIAAIAWGYWLMSRQSGLSAWNVFLSPLAAAVFVYTLLRSMVTTLLQGGVIWRGTFYPLATLRKHTSPLL